MSKKRKCNTQKTVERKTGENDDGGQQPIPRKQRREKQRWHRKHQSARERENKREKDDDRSEFPRRRRAVLFFISLIFSRNRWGEKQFSVQIQSIANGRDALTFFVFFFRKVKNCVGVCKRCVFYAHVRRACSSVLLLLEVETYLKSQE